MTTTAEHIEGGHILHANAVRALHEWATYYTPVGDPVGVLQAIEAGSCVLLDLYGRLTDDDERREALCSISSTVTQCLRR